MLKSTTLDWTSGLQLTSCRWRKCTTLTLWLASHSHNPCKWPIRNYCSWLFNWSRIIEIGRAWYLSEPVLWVFPRWVACGFCGLDSSGKYGIGLHSIDGRTNWIVWSCVLWWCCRRHEILLIYNKTNNENLDEKMSKWIANKINIRSSVKYCYIFHLAQLTLK